HYAEIVRYLAARLGSRDAAADVAAEVFLEAYKRAPLLSWRGKPVLAWLYRVASNMAADHVKRAARELPVAEVGEAPVADETHSGAEPGEALELAALLERAAEPARFDVDVEAALGRVRPRPRPRLVLRPVLGVAALMAAAVVLVLALPFSHAPGIDLQARALAA